MGSFQTLTWSSEASHDDHVRISVTPGRAPVWPVSEAGSGSSTREWFASYDRESSSWKTSQRSLLAGWDEFSETWPKQGMTQSGRAFELPMSVPRIDGSGCLLWPTPTAQQSQNRTCSRLNPQSVHHDGVTLLDALALLELNPRECSPAWVEPLMGFPDGWTSIDGPPAPAKRNTTGNRRVSRKASRIEPLG